MKLHVSLKVILRNTVVLHVLTFCYDAPMIGVLQGRQVPVHRGRGRVHHRHQEPRGERRRQVLVRSQGVQRLDVQGILGSRT